jgi:hypothetical protein
MNAAAGVTTIHAIAKKHPEQALFAAVIHQALNDARAGDSEAAQWLGSNTCLWYCGHVAPDGVEPTLIQARLIEAAGLQVD